MRLRPLSVTLVCSMMVLLSILTGCVLGDSYAIVGQQLDEMIRHAKQGNIELKLLDDPFGLKAAIYVGEIPYSPGILPMSHASQFSFHEWVGLDRLAEGLRDGEAEAEILLELFSQDVSGFFGDALSLVHPGHDDHPFLSFADQTEHIRMAKRMVGKIGSTLVETVDQFDLMLDDARVAEVFHETLWRKAGGSWKLNCVSVTYAIDREFLENFDWGDEE
jgi:hypothetical protein